MVYTPRDVITVLEKRAPGDNELKQVAEYFEKLGFGDPHASPSSAPPGSEHGSMNNVQAPGSALPGPEHGSMNDEQGLVPSAAPSTGQSEPIGGTAEPIVVRVWSGRRLLELLERFGVS